MTPEEVGTELIQVLQRATGQPADARASVSGGDRWARATVDVAALSWVSAITAARDHLDCDFFDWLSAVDELDQSNADRGYTIVCHLWSTAARHGVLIRTQVPRQTPGAGHDRRRLPRCQLARTGDPRDVRSRLPGPPQPRTAAAPARVRRASAAQGLRAGLAGRESLARRQGARRARGASVSEPRSRERKAARRARGASAARSAAKAHASAGRSRAAVRAKAARRARGGWGQAGADAAAGRTGTR